MKPFLLFILVISAYKSSASLDDYFTWVDLARDVPEKAVIAGKDSNNNTVYIARVFIQEEASITNATGYVPGSIIAGQTSIDVVLYGKILSVSEGIQILTAANNTKLEWIDVDYISFPRLFDTEYKHPVRSGWEFDGLEFNSTVYIGRVNVDGDINIGKIFTTAVLYADNNVLYFPGKSSHQVEVSNEYSALVYYY